MIDAVTWEFLLYEETLSGLEWVLKKSETYGLSREQCKIIANLILRMRENKNVRKVFYSQNACRDLDAFSRYLLGAGL